MSEQNIDKSLANNQSLPTPKKRWRGILVNLLVLGISLLICLLVLELAARLFLADQQPLMRPDKFVGELYVPNRTVDYYNTEVKKTVTIKSNSWGFRDREFTIAKPPQTKRIAIFGDSFTDAVQVEYGQRFSEQLEKLLNSAASTTTYEVMNFAIGGTGTAQQYRIYQHYASLFKPDIVAVGFYSGNDVENNSVRLTPNSERTGYTLDANGQLESTPVSFKQKLVWQVRTFLGDHSVLFRVVYKYLPAVKPLHNFLMKLGFVPSQLAATKSAVALPPSTQILKKEYDQTWQNAWAVTEEIFKEFNLSAEENQADLVIFDIPDAYQCYDDKFKELFSGDRDATTSDFILDKPEQILGELAAANNINYLSLLAGCRKIYEEKNECLHFNCRGHLTPAGHQLAAEELYNYLKEKNLVD